MDHNPTLLMPEEKIGKYLAGEANPEEATIIEDWISSSPANKELFDQYQQVWNCFQNTSGYPAPAKSEAWAQLQDNLVSPGNAISSAPVRNLVRPYRVAVAIAAMILISASVYLYFRQGNKTFDKEITISAAGNIERKILPDNSQIVLYSHSSLRLPEKFSAGSRQTYLQGEAYFIITPDPSNPFIISIDGINIQVAGTSFNVNNSVEKGIIETQVTTGKVKMYNSRGQVMITAGQTGVYNKKTDTFFVEDSLNINRFGYATRNFDFIDEKLASIIAYLEKAYSKKIVLDNPQLGNCKMTSSFENKSIEYVLEVIAATLNLTLKISNGIIHIGGKREGC
jgi:transmembrane sensor